mmetsp:Transcript_28442/g.39171  ORF Transcript_28442/g.39171 Transcript_28442/m.39171 type:complete len:114 (-) Transcript_28442:957-1298(-)
MLTMLSTDTTIVGACGLIKCDFEHRLPNNIRFIISATYTLSTDFVPMDFKTLPKLVHGDFRLSKEVVDEYIRLSSVRMGAERVGGPQCDFRQLQWSHWRSVSVSERDRPALPP